MNLNIDIEVDQDISNIINKYKDILTQFLNEINSKLNNIKEIDKYKDFKI